MSKSIEIDIQNYVSQFYEESRYQKDYSLLYHKWWNKKMLSFVSVNGKVLDNGCGTGIMGSTLSDAPELLVGLDISINMLKYAKCRLDKIVHGDSQKLPFQDNSFNVVIGRSLLHHLPDPFQGLKEMARVLKNNGEMIIVDTNNSILSHVPRIIANKGKHFSDDHKNMSHKELIHMIQQLFIVETVYFFGYLAYPIGFPDVFDIGKYLPSPIHNTKTLIKIDELISRIPLLRTQSWGIMIKGIKKGQVL
jgi:ubiquinone/menaquinone biosynthesis C-methylase UbiE